MKLFENELTQLWDVVCPKCKSAILNKNGKYRERQRFICMDCGYSFTTYSKSILDSTKLSENQWDKIIEGIIQLERLKDLSKDLNVSLVSLSNIRRNIFDSLYDLSPFERVLKKHRYDPFDTSTIFIPNTKRGTMYYYLYNPEVVIAFIRYREHIFISKSFETKEFNQLITSVNYETLDFIPFSECQDEEGITYIENLLFFLKSFRGIKKSLFSQYCNFYDYKLNLDQNEFKQLIIAQIKSHKKRND